jgi:dihydrofolate reductase
VARLIYSAIASLDGYVADVNGNFDWAAPDEEVHAFVNELERPAGTYLYGRRTYDVMVAWESMSLAGEPPSVQAYAKIWRAADKVVFSRTLKESSSTRTRLEREFNVDAVRKMKQESGRDISVGGPDLAAQALKAALVDEVRMFLSPVIVGGGTRALPDGVHLDVELADQRRFHNGVVYLRYSA